MTSPDEFPSLRHQLLVAMPRLADPRFHQSVTYLVEHNAEGAMGLIVNRPLDLPLADLFAQLDITPDPGRLAGLHLLYGGPVEESRGFVVFRDDGKPGRWRHEMEIGHGIRMATSRDILESLASGNGPDTALVALGYAGWGPGQLEREMAENSWLCAPADAAFLFDLPFDSRWQAAARRIGVDLSLLSPDAGHA